MFNLPFVSLSNFGDPLLFRLPPDLFFSVREREREGGGGGGRESAFNGRKLLHVFQSDDRQKNKLEQKPRRENPSFEDNSQKLRKLKSLLRPRACPSAVSL